MKDWTFLFGPGFVVPFGNGLILGYLMYRSRLVPRRMAWFGMIGGPLLLVWNLGALFDWWGANQRGEPLGNTGFIWEAFLGIYCAIWGFRRDSPILRPRGADGHTYVVDLRPMKSGWREANEPADQRHSRRAGPGTCGGL